MHSSQMLGLALSAVLVSSRRTSLPVGVEAGSRVVCAFLKNVNDLYTIRRT